MKQNTAPAAAPVKGTSLRGLHALIVDDNETNRKVLHHLLDRWGVTDLAVGSAAAALDALHHAADSPQPFDIVLLDMHMPVQDGLMLADAIRQTPLARPPRLVMLNSMDVRLDGAGQAGHRLEACLTKPLRPAQLFQCLVTVMRDLPPAEQPTVRGAAHVRFIPALQPAGRRGS